jgi:anti-sigma regulatory factor (Ser/Thr protein kinase)
MPPRNAARRGRAPRFTPATPPVPRDPAAPAHRWPGHWPLRSYLELGATDRAPGSARAHAAAVLWEWGLTAINDETTLVVSEMLTNAVQATRAHRLPAPVRLWLLGSRSGVLVLAWDATSPAPVPRAAAPDDEHGRGLTLVNALSARWGCYRPAGHPGGKVTWALITPEPPAIPSYDAPVRRTAA